MSLRPKMRLPEKVAWMALIAAMLCAEIHSIRSDRASNDAEQAKIRDAEDRRFDNIAKGLEDSITLSKSQFATTVSDVNGVLSTTQNVAALAQDSLGSVTGGDSFCYMKIWPDRGPLVAHEGKYPLYSVSARVAELDSSGSGTDRDTEFDVGDLTFGTVWMNPGAAVHFSSQESAKFNIFFMARNGSWAEILRMRKVDGEWEHALKVTVTTPVRARDGKLKPHEYLAKEEISAKFPQSDLIGDYGWNRKVPPQRDYRSPRRRLNSK